MFRLRWRFDYNGRNAKCGMWDKDPDNVKEKACYQLKEGLVRASIEGKDANHNVITLAQCDGWDFCNFLWMAMWRGNPKAGVGYHQHIGMQIMTREKLISVLRTGAVREELRTEEDKKYNYAIYGR